MKPMDIVLQNNAKSQSPFDSIRRMDEKGQEYWSARELMPMLGYARWDRVPDVIERASIACQNAGNPVPEHFSEKTSKTNGRPQQDFYLSRYACYLVAMSSDSRKPEIAVAQGYFANKLMFADYVVWRETGNVPDVFGNIPTNNGNDQSGFVYLVRQMSTTYYKIGKSKNPYKRLESLQTGTPLEIQVIERYFSMDCTKLESLLHGYYSAYWVRGEWFDFPDGIVFEFLSVCRELDDKVERCLSSADVKKNQLNRQFVTITPI